MPIQIVRNDITKMKVDGIVNAANSSLLGGGGVDGCIHRAAGPGLLAECRLLGGCDTGSAKMTGAYGLPCKYVIHAVGPRWCGGNRNEEALLQSCYRTSLELAKRAGCETLAFPLISSGIYGYPKDRALKVAVDTISAFLLENDMTVFIVIFDKDAFPFSEALLADIEEYIDDRYVEAHGDEAGEDLPRQKAFGKRILGQKSSGKLSCRQSPVAEEDVEALRTMNSAPAFAEKEEKIRSLEDAMMRLDESFSEMLLRKIDESGMTDAECYKKANIDRKLFSKIRSEKLYKPSKPTAIAFAIALELSLEETRNMLMKAGFALSHSNKFDIIIEYFIENENYNILEINEALFAFDQNLLGA